MKATICRALLLLKVVVNCDVKENYLRDRFCRTSDVKSAVKPSYQKYYWKSCSFSSFLAFSWHTFNIRKTAEIHEGTVGQALHNCPSLKINFGENAAPVNHICLSCYQRLYFQFANRVERCQNVLLIEFDMKYVSDSQE